MKEDPCETQVNWTEAVEDPIQSSEEPKADFAQEGKPRNITAISNLCNYLLLLLVH